MTDNVAIAVITAMGSVFAAAFSFLNNVMVRRAERQVREVAAIAAALKAKLIPEDGD